MPTLKQQKAIRELSENIRIPIGKAMRDSGYSLESSLKPKILTNSKAFIEWAKDELPPDKLFKAHRDSLDATKWNDFTGEREPDHAIRLKGAIEGYKIHGIGNGISTTNNQINITFDSQGFIPQDNLLNIKPTKRK